MNFYRKILSLFIVSLALLSASARETQSLPLAEVAELVSFKAMAPSSDVPSLILIATSAPEHETVREAWTKLGQIAEPRDIPKLLFILETPRDGSLEPATTQGIAINALTAIVQKSGGREIFVDHFTRSRNSMSPLSKLRSIEVLEKLDTHDSRNLVNSLVSDTDIDVQRAAVSALGVVDSSQIAGLVAGFLSSSNPPLKKAAILALGRSKHLPAIPKLISLLDSKEPGVRANVQWSLRNISGRTFESASDANLWLTTETADCESRFQTALAQIKTGDPRVIPLAIEELGNLVLISNKINSILVPLLNHSNFRVRAAACDALARLSPTTAATSQLIEKLRDPSDVVSATACRALKRLTGKSFSNNFDLWNNWLLSRI